MATITQHAPGTFSWPELATTDQPGAKKFYSALLGWDMNDSEMGGGEYYTMIMLKDRNVGALYNMRPEERSQGIPPHWNSYVTVESADQSAAKAKSLGGTLLGEPFDVMDVGRMAIIQDPAGAVFCVWEAKKHIGAGVLGETGSLVWTELLTTDVAKAQPFYTGLFGWKAEAMPMGPMTYTIYKNGSEQAGGMMQITKEMGPMPSNWMVYFGVDDVDASAARATSLGGTIAMPPHDIPNIGRFAVLMDPQGAAFSVFKPNEMR
jgi:predicted enzyme related to lactoylglutathione lyase